MQKDRIKAYIIETAKEYFYNYGTVAVSMSELARVMKMSKKTIYKYFKSKEQLALAVFKDTQNELLTKLENTYNSPHLSILNKIKMLVKQKVEVASKMKPSYIKDIKKYIDLELSVERTEDEIVTGYLLKILEDGKKKGIVREDVDLILFIEVLKGAINRFLSYEALNRFSISTDKAIEMIFDICLNGVLTNKPQSSAGAENKVGMAQDIVKTG